MKLFYIYFVVCVNLLFNGFIFANETSNLEHCKQYYPNIVKFLNINSNGAKSNLVINSTIDEVTIDPNNNSCQINVTVGQEKWNYQWDINFGDRLTSYIPDNFSLDSSNYCKSTYHQEVLNLTVNNVPAKSNIVLSSENQILINNSTCAIQFVISGRNGLGVPTLHSWKLKFGL